MKKILALTLTLGLAIPALAQDVQPAGTPAKPKEAAKTASTPVPTPEPAVEPPPAPTTAPAGKPVVRSKRSVEVYGFLKLTAAADTGVDAGNYARWARPGEHDGQFNMTANETRLGLDFLKEGDEFPVSGKLEMDFMGGGAENKANPMMRHAYFEVSNPEWNGSVLAGQTWDVIAPLNPPSSNYSVYWWVGNIGYRRPQLRLTHAVGKAAAQVAFARTVGDQAGTGEDAGVPTVEGRLAITPSPGAVLGVWGHFGEEEVGDTDYVTSSAGADLAVKLGPKAEIKGEAWMGRNLDAFLGGVGQGLNGAREVHARGGWGSLQIGPYRGLKFHVGGGVDNPDDPDVAAGGKTRNSAGWGGISKTVAAGTTMDLEYTYLDTRYHHGPMGTSHRGQFSMTYGF